VTIAVIRARAWSGAAAAASGRGAHSGRSCPGWPVVWTSPGGCMSDFAQPADREA